MKMNENLASVLKKYETHPEFLGLSLSSVNQKGAVDNAPLHIAAGVGEVSDMKVLIEHGADIDSQGDIGNTPLHFAAMRGQEEAVKLLLDKGADKTKKNEFDQTPLRVAELGNHRGLYSMLK